MSVCSFLGRYFLYLFNILCLISSIGLLSIGFITSEAFKKWPNFISNKLISMPQILLIIGLVVLVIAVIGLCSVIRDSGCLLTLFSILLTIVLMGELLLSAVIYHMRNDIEQFALNQMNYTIYTYNTTGHETFTETWDVLQIDLECCGIYGPKDWQPITHNDKLPYSCCHAIPEGDYCTLPLSFNDGCFEKLEKNIQDNSQIIIWTAIGFALVQLLAVFLACCRKCSLLREYETV